MITALHLVTATLTTTIVQHGLIPRHTPTLRSPNCSTLQTFTMISFTNLDSMRRLEILRPTTMVKEVKEAMLLSSTHKMDKDSTTQTLQPLSMANPAECPCSSGTTKFPTATAVSMLVLSFTNTLTVYRIASLVVQQTPTA